MNICLVRAELFHLDRQTRRFPKYWELVQKKNDTIRTNYVMIHRSRQTGPTTTKPSVETDQKNKTKQNKIKSFP